MWTRGNVDNGFIVEVFDIDGNNVLTLGPFKTAEDADRAGEMAQRRVIFPPAAKSREELEEEMVEIGNIIRELHAYPNQNDK